jgi:hypothetical protein
VISLSQTNPKIMAHKKCLLMKEIISFNEKCLFRVEKSLQRHSAEVALKIEKNDKVIFCFSDCGAE